MANRIMVDKFVSGKILTELAIIIEKMPMKRISKDKIPTSYQNSVAPIRKGHLLNNILLLYIIL